MRLVNTDSLTLWNSSLEDLLANDDVLVDFLNQFLSLPTFPETIKYNTETGAFEVVSDAVRSLHSRIRKALHDNEAKFLTDSLWLTAAPMFDNSYTVLCLDREQGMQWLKKARLPLFLQSDYYLEYRLVKLLSQLVCPGHRQDDAMGLAARTSYPQSPLCCTDQDLKDGLSFISRGNQAACEHAGGGDKPEEACEAEAKSKACLYLTESEEREDTMPSSRPATAGTGETGLITSLVNHVLQVAVSELQVCGARAGLETRQQATGAPEQQPHTATACVGAEMNEFNNNDTAMDEPVHRDAPCLCFHGSRQALEQFKSFLQDTPGEKVLYLWIDIERLKTLGSPKGKNRLLVEMRNQYMPSSGLRALSSELLSRLGLSSSNSWIEDRLLCIQPCLSETLLTYWGPLFCMVKSASERHGVMDPQQWQLRWQRRRLHSSAVGEAGPLSSITLPSAPPHPTSSPTGEPVSGSSPPVVGARRMERMLQALHVEPRAGFYFTHFCELSGNKVWESAIHCWTHLLEYQQLFQRAGLDPYRAQRRAQMLYSTYLCSASPESIGVDEECRKQVFARLTPPFEELFDGVEAHTLTLLLEPWTLLTSQDTHIYEQVDLWEETRHVETEDYRKLQTLHTESVRRMEQLALGRKCVPPPPEVPREPDSWAQVPEQFRGFRLVSVLRNRTELQHFQAFLEENSASMDLLCWLDLEQLKRTPSQQQEQRAQRFHTIKTKYLNRRYFFGPGSPATRHQQDEVIRLGGGWGQLLQNGLSGAPLIEMQNIVRNRIERKWLPIYLSSPDFSDRQKLQPQAEERRRRYHRRKKAWKPSQPVDGAWMASSTEVLAFRQALLNPVTCLQFQRFVALKGDLYENDVLFWQEVQRYKDLCHSHSEEATIQHKISTIIGCFINSSVPPTLQISISPEQACTILEKRKELGPYVFREAQMSVFNELYKLWPQFLDFKKSVGEGEDLLSLLERKRARQRERELQRRREEEEEEEEERKAQEALNKQQEEAGDEALEGRGDQEDEELELPTDQLCWSYSKYMAALEREAVLIHKQMMEEEALASFSTGRDSVSTPSLRSEVIRKAPDPAATARARSPKVTGPNTLTGH